MKDSHKILYNKQLKLTTKLTHAALIAAIGAMLPQVFHMIGGQAAGTMFLPMHIPVILAGIYLGPVFGVAVGIITPLLSHLIFSMPPAAKLPFMLTELVAYGLTAGLIALLLKKNLSSKTDSAKKSRPIKFYIATFICVLCAQISGRAIYALCLIFAGSVLKLQVSGPIAVITSLATGFVGILIQWIIIPPLVLSLRTSKSQINS